MSTQTLKLDGKPYVLMDKESYDHLKAMSKMSALPPLPQTDSKGNLSR